MLTADLVEARKRGDELVLRAMDPALAAEALALAARYLEAAKSHLGRSRQELVAAWDELDGDASRRRVAMGLRKLTLDACVFETAAGDAAPAALRREVFLRAAAARRAGGPGAEFDRQRVLEEAGAAVGLPADELERAMFADLKGEHVLRSPPAMTAAGLVHAYEEGAAQAVLLTAVRVTCDVRATSTGPLRAFFAKLKFHRLLFSAERTAEGFRVVLDGPFSMFESVTKYGLSFALVLPALRELDTWSMVAELRWGKTREPLSFRLTSRDIGGRTDRGAREPIVADDVQELLTGLEGLESGWTFEVARTFLEVPGLGVCVPDVVARRGNKTVYVEVMGYWSREAVWKRVDMAAQGAFKDAPVIFAASSRLRVSETVLDDTKSAALYVYKGKMSPRAVLERIQKVARVRRGKAAPRVSRPRPPSR